MTDRCIICQRDQDDRPMCFKNEQWCSENCHKATLGEDPIPSAE